MFGLGVLKGLGVTLKNFVNTYVDDARYMFRSTTNEQAFARRQGPVGDGLFTVEYPEMKLKTPENFRFLPFLITDYEVAYDSPEFDQEQWLEQHRCTACGICAKVCPPQCIWIVRSSDPETGKPVTKAAQFYIDTDICMNCGFCAEYCPFDAIKMDHDFELSDYERDQSHIYDVFKLTKPTSHYASIRPTWNAMEDEARRQAEEEKQRKAAEKEAAAAKAAEAKAKAEAAKKAAAAKTTEEAEGNGQEKSAIKPKRTPEEIKAQREAMMAKKREREAQQAAKPPEENKPAETAKAAALPLIKVEGIGEVYAGKLKEFGLSTVDELLEKGSTPAGRKEIAEQSDISPKLILRWVNMVDLFRIKGVSEEYADLLEAAGVDTVPELAQRNPENLHQKMVETNQEKSLVRRVPGQAQVESWVTQAKELPRKINY